MGRGRATALVTVLGLACAPALATVGRASAQTAVGSQVTGDFDGDGVADLAIGAPRHGQVLVRYSHFEKNHSHDESLGLGAKSSAEEFGTAVATGDVNGDGFADLVVGAPDYTVPDPVWEIRYTGAVITYAGSSTGLHRLGEVPTGYGDDEPAELGNVLAVADVDGDGYDDVVTNMTVGDDVYREYYRGSETGFDTHPTQESGLGTTTQIALGDVNGDGLVDLVSVTPQDFVGGIVQGRVSVYLGTETHLFDTTPALVTATQVGYRGLGRGVVVTDVDHDGYDDVLVGSGSAYAGSADGPGHIVDLRGGPDGLSASDRRIFSEKQLSSHWQPQDGFGSVLAVGRAGLSIGAPKVKVSGRRAAGAAYVVPFAHDWVATGRARRITQATPGVPGSPAVQAAFGSSLLDGVTLSSRDVLTVGVPHTFEGRGAVVRIPAPGGALKTHRATRIRDHFPGTGFGTSLA